jgi:hypothetical protein
MMMVLDDKYNKKPLSLKDARVQQGLILCFLSILLALMVILSGPSSSGARTSSSSFDGLKVLYIVTTLNEYDNGARNTVKGNDRLQETLIPVVRENVESMLSFGYQVDVVLICHYEMTREQLVRASLPPSVGLQVWDTATPLGYKLEDKKNNFTQDITRALARQHRFVIKDKFQHYDFFVNFEDDMVIKGDTVHQYIDVTQELYRLRAMAPEVAPTEQIKGGSFYGSLTKAKLQRMVPGFIRVEVLLDEATFGGQEELDPVPVTNRPNLDPKPCCHFHNPLTVSPNRPDSPKSDKLVLWETNIKALGIRKLPLQSKFDWVLMQRGPRYFEQNVTIGDYWSGQDGYYKSLEDPNRPVSKSFAHINNQGGWMATRHQIWEWHTEVCPGGFLPPYESPYYNLDGLDMRNVEYWSGGLGLFTQKNACNLQRIIPLDPSQFARHLLYHSANNKQRQLHGKRSKMVKANDLLGELNTVRKNAEAEMHRHQAAMSDTLHSV